MNNNKLPIWMLDLAIHAAHAAVLSGMINGEWRTINGTTMPLMHMSEDARQIGPVQFNIEVGGLWVRLDMEDMEVRNEAWGNSRSLILIFKQGVTLQLDFRA